MNSSAETELSSMHQRRQGWQYLRLFNYYRSFLALLFLVLHLNGWTEQFIHPQDYHPQLFVWTAVCYLLACLIFMFSIQYRRPGLDAQVILQTCVDVIAIIIIMHASGGVRSGIGMLLVVNVSMTSQFLQRRVTLLLAAATSLAVLGEQAYSQLFILQYNPEYPQAGILGMLIFSFAIITSVVSRRLRETQQLADRRNRALRNVVQMNEHIIRNMRTGIMVVNASARVEMANNAAEALLGNVRIHRGAPLQQIFPGLSERYREWRQSSEVIQQKPLQQSHGLPDIQPGFSRIMQEKGFGDLTLIFLEDASQLNQRFQQVRLASLGRLTASIAHEIRNPLAAIHHAAQLLAETIENAGERKLTSIINAQVQRLNSVVENVLQLSRQQRGSTEIIVLLSWLLKFKNEWIASQGLKADQVRIQIEPNDTHILFDTGQLHQVMWNLCSNAVNHADMDIAKVEINIQGGITMDSSQPFIDIIDNGPGIDEDIAQQIFDPFFTTRAKGTGLGLYITKEVIENNRARIKHIALPTGGTCFRIYFMPAPEKRLPAHD
jgi:two-component system, NtrC family, sensor histidine kinase PilS